MTSERQRHIRERGLNDVSATSQRDHREADGALGLTQEVNDLVGCHTTQGDVVYLWGGEDVVRVQGHTVLQRAASPNDPSAFVCDLVDTHPANLTPAS